MTDNDPMPFGKYKGDKLANVPASYLIWLYDNEKCYSYLKLAKYIKDNMDALQKEAANNDKFYSK